MERAAQAQDGGGGAGERQAAARGEARGGGARSELLPHGRGGDPMAEAGQSDVDAAVAPGRVLGGEAQDESTDLDRCRWASRSSGGMCPVTGDAATVPSQHGVGCDVPACSL